MKENMAASEGKKEPTESEQSHCISQGNCLLHDHKHTDADDI